MNGQKSNGRLISFDESGFTGPELLNEEQPFFVYASHDLTAEEADQLLNNLRTTFRIQGPELKANRLKKRKYWEAFSDQVCQATDGRSKVITFEKRTALSGKFFEYFFEPVLAANSMAFYRIDFHRYIMNTVNSLMLKSGLDYSSLTSQMQAFMRTFDPSVAPDMFGGQGQHPIEIERILKFCSAYAEKIATETENLRPESDATGKWALDLTSSSLFSLLFHGWGHRYPLLRVLCDDSKPLADVADAFNGWVGEDQAVAITDGKKKVELKGNLVAPMEFGSSEIHSTIQVADLLAGMTSDVCLRQGDAPQSSQTWVRRNRMRSHSVWFDPETVKKNNPTVRVGREVLKELARRAEAGIDPLEGMAPFIDKTVGNYRK
jgi:hypothetical protein